MVSWRQYRCTKCNLRCKTCRQWDWCTTCKEGYYLNPTGPCILNNSYYSLDTSTFIATLCSIPLANCSTCSPDGSRCLTCQMGFYASPLTIVPTPADFASLGSVACLPCSPTPFNNCANCSATFCYSCTPPFVFTGLNLCEMPSNISPFKPFV